MSSKLMLKLKKKKKQKTLQTSAQRVALRACQKQLSELNLKEVLILAGFALSAATLRSFMQGWPSVEPIIFFSVLSGWLFGNWKGFAVGASSLYISNFLVFGGQGPWTIFQALAFAAAGFCGGFLRKKASVFEAVTLTIVATLVFELIINFSTPFMLGPFSILTAFAFALPFALMHLVSNTAFALALKPAKKFVEKKGGFNERDICRNILAKHNIVSKLKPKANTRN